MKCLEENILSSGVEWEIHSAILVSTFAAGKVAIRKYGY